MINSDELQFFSILASHPSLASAARHLNVSAPSVTQRLQAIENKLAIKLVQRNIKGLRLTDDGELLLMKSKKILDDISELHEQVTANKNKIQGTLKVLAPLGFGDEFIAPAMSDFHKIHPQLSIELEVSDNPNWADSHQWDMIIHIGELRDSSLKVIKLAENKRFLCASPSYIKKYGTPQEPKDLLNHQCIALRENAEDVTLWRFSLKNSDVEQSIRITPHWASNKGSVVKDWAIKGHGIIMRSEWDVMRDINSGKLVKILPEYTLPQANIVILLGTDNKSRSQKTKTFLTYLQKRMSSKPWLTYTPS